MPLSAHPNRNAFPSSSPSSSCALLFVYRLGGVELHQYQLAQGLIRRGHHVIIVTGPYEAEGGGSVPPSPAAVSAATATAPLSPGTSAAAAAAAAAAASGSGMPSPDAKDPAGPPTFGLPNATSSAAA